MKTDRNIFFFDIDGTLANGLNVPESAQIAIKELRNRNNLVFICTGRPVGYVMKHFSQYCDGCICFNGRYAVYNEEVLYDVPLTLRQVSDLAVSMDRLKAGYVFHNNTRHFAGGWFNGKYHSLDTEGEQVYNFIVYFTSYEDGDRLVAELKDTCILNYHYPETHADATIIGADKGTAIQAVLNALHIHKENSYAFGDGTNDVCMLNAAGHGIAMGNGTAECRNAAEFITDSINENGIMNALKHYGFL